MPIHTKSLSRTLERSSQLLVQQRRVCLNPSHVISLAQPKNHHRDASSTTTDAGASPGPGNAPDAADKAQVIFSGIQPTGVPHLGNYLGALKQWVALQDGAEPGTKLLYSIVDLHAITVPQKAKYLRQQRKQMLAALLAVGLDPFRSTIFYQSSVPAHTELMWILSCTASMGYLSRMTQWKSKLSLSDDTSALDDQAKNALKLGLFSYPVLQAADIMVHRATHVPVGEDQRQHIEFARECATNFSATHKAGILVPPKTLLSPTRRIMSLTKPTSKMSKSDPNTASRILITDTDSEIANKIRRALTDSHSGIVYDPATRPGVSNLLEILSAVEQISSENGSGRTPTEVAEDFASVQHPLKSLKDCTTEAVMRELRGVRERYEGLMDRECNALLEKVEAAGAEKARASAAETMKRVRKAVGF